VTSYLHMSIGPVQTFVAQSRRTRDLWASSYLLSFLAASAMHGAVRAGAKLVSPQLRGNKLWRWLTERATELPSTGSVPNQFTLAAKTHEDAVRLATLARAEFAAAWNKVAGAVWKQFVAEIVPAKNLASAPSLESKIARASTNAASARCR
jgi:CRISPR-associated protein Cmr2